MYECEDLVLPHREHMLERPAGECRQESGACSLQDSYRTHKYPVWAERSFSVKPGGMYTDH